MRPQSHTHAADQAIAMLASRQHGVVARRQLIEAGVTARQIKLRLRNARLHEIHRGVYLPGHTVLTPHARDMAALLACGDEAVLSHRSAAAIWDLLPYPAAAPAWVTVPPERGAARPGIQFHRASVPRADRRSRERMSVTSPPRTILDLAASLGSQDLERLIAEAYYRRLAGEQELRDQLAGFRGYELNSRIHGFEVDVLWRELDFAVEIDGYEAHSGRLAFERDRLKVAALKAWGLDVMPVTARQLRDDPGGVFARLLRALELAGYPATG